MQLVLQEADQGFYDDPRARFVGFFYTLARRSYV